MSRPWQGLRRRLLHWFDQQQRDLPWRVNRDPYAIWVSEVMLQQTTVAAVIPVFQRFLAAYPTIRDLASADLQSVLRSWEGLGYYRRARHLHAAAAQLLLDHAGEFPDDPDAVAALPGVGRYILGAVLSQAFNRRLPILEANSQRVLARWLGERGDITTTAVRRRLWQVAEDLLPRQRVGDFNQALMELGALICTISQPRCGECPLARECVALRDHLQAVIPHKPAPPAAIAVAEYAIVIRRGDQVLLVQRPADAARWAGMWEFPHAEARTDESPTDAIRRLAHELTGFAVEPLGAFATIKHGVTKYAITLTAWDATATSGEFVPGAYAGHAWLRPSELANYPVSSPQRRLANLVAEPVRQRRLFE